MVTAISKEVRREQVTANALAFATKYSDDLPSSQNLHAESFTTEQDVGRMS